MALSKTLLLFIVLSTCSLTCFNQPLKKTDNPLIAEIKLPKGFRISLFADNIDNARSMTLGEKGTVFVGSRESDKVIALVDADGDGKAETRYVVAKKMHTPNGVAFYKGALYIAEVDKIWRLDNIESRLASPPKPVLVFDSLPHDKHHGWKYIAFGPDGKLYVPIGAPCNNCDDAEKDPRYASICRLNADGTGFEIFASGIRNTVGFHWHPQSHELWFTDNGRDMMGENLPPDELNKAPKKGMHFGYPYCHGINNPDPEYGKKHSCTEFTRPEAELGPHVAALGMKFYSDTMFPAEYRNRIFIAEHGSWNRSVPIGYRVTMVSFKADGTPVYQTFADGWLKDGKAWGRPVDILQLKDGSLLVSDDFANCIYRITYSK
jgi:glucose/arabinose dehydrogenase